MQFTNFCKFCASPTKVRFTKLDSGDWFAFELDGTGAHRCNEKPHWKLAKLGHPFTCEVECWWCHEKVFYHTEGHGDSVLFDQLGDPWPKHRCWEVYAENRKEFLKALEQKLWLTGYDGKAFKYDLFRKGRWVMQKRYKLRLTSADHRALDQAVSDITHRLRDHKVAIHGPIPLPSRKQSGGLRINKRVITIMAENQANEAAARSALESLQGLDVPSTVEISVTSK